MIYIIALVVGVIITTCFVILRRPGSQPRFSYAPDRENLEDNLSTLDQLRVVPIPSPMEVTEELVQRETVDDVSDDLLNPRNTNHAQYIHQHPDLETDEEWITDHPYDATS